MHERHEPTPRALQENALLFASGDQDQGLMTLPQPSSPCLSSRKGALAKQSATTIVVRSDEARVASRASMRFASVAWFLIYAVATMVATPAMSTRPGVRIISGHEYVTCTQSGYVSLCTVSWLFGEAGALLC